MPRQIKKGLLSSHAGRWIAPTILLLLLPLATGCWVQSVYPFYEDSDVIVEKSLVGTWIGESELKDCALKITLESGLNTYTIELSNVGSDTDIHCGSGSLKGKLVQFGRHHFLDVEPEITIDDKVWASLDMIWKVDTDKQHLALTPLDAEWTADALARKTVKLQGRSQEEEEYGTVLPFTLERVYLSSPTSDLREFLRQHGGDKSAFSESGRMDFRRNGDKPSESSTIP